MGIPFAIVLVIGVVLGAVLLVWVATTRRRTRPVDAADRAVTSRATDLPSPGDPPPQQHGRPIPGSETARNQQGKP